MTWGRLGSRCGLRVVVLVGLVMALGACGDGRGSGSSGSGGTAGGAGIAGGGTGGTGGDSGSCSTGYVGDGTGACTPTLTGLTLSAGTLTPALGPTVTDYTAQVILGTQTITLTPTVPSGATVTINGTGVTSGSPWQSPVLDLGGNVLTIIVSQSGRPSRSYTLTVTRGNQHAYVKASNTEADDAFGYAVSLSADGNTLAVGADPEASNGTGVNSDTQGDNSASDAGAVYVFTRSGVVWIQQAYLKASNTDAGDYFGIALSLSADGNTLAVGAVLEASSGTGVDSDTQGDDSASGSGAVYLFTRSGAVWTQQAYLKASNTDADDHFGIAVSLSADGNTLAVGADREDSNGTGVNSDTLGDNSASDAGAVYVFTRSGAVWGQQAYVKASNTDAFDYFGAAVWLSADGNTLAVGAPNEASSGTGVNSDTPADNSASEAGAVYVFTRSGAVWSQEAYVKASNTDAFDYFGIVVSLSGDGNRLAVGASGEASSGTGVNSDTQDDNSASEAGAVYVFTRSGGAWSQQAYVKASNTDASDNFGYAVSLSGDGNRLAVGAPNEASSGTGVNSNTQGDNSAGRAGAAYVFTRSSAVWSQEAYVKASNTGADHYFGSAVSLSANGNTLAVGAWGEASNGTGVNSDTQDDNSAGNSGAVYVF